MRLFFTVLLFILLTACGADPTPPLELNTVNVTSRTDAWVQGSVDAPDHDVEVNFLVTLPPELDPQQSYPLEIHLPHGGTVGAGPDALAELGRPSIMRQRPADYPFIVAYAQLPGRAISWYELAEEVMIYRSWLIREFPVDESRIYLTGYSNGGRGALEVGTQHADQFAAVAVYAGFYEREISELCGFGSTPLHLYHGTADETIPIEQSRAAATTLTECGGDVTLTELEGVGHFDLWVRLLQGSDVYDWLLQYEG